MQFEAVRVPPRRVELLAHVLGVTRTAVVAGLAPEPDAAQSAAFAALVAERARGVPLAYLLLGFLFHPWVVGVPAFGR